MIKVNNITKKYKVSNKQPGLSGAVSALFKPTYKEIVAVDDISFEIAQGTIVGLIGANGAGKSTMIKMMCGILYPSSGDITIDGLVPYDNRKKNARDIGVVFGQRSQLIREIALEESLRMQQKIYGVEKNLFEERLKFFVDLLELDELMRKPIRQMSLGQKMRAELAAAFLHKPKVVYLDEPTIGLDVRVKERIRDFILEIAKKDKITVILTTHDMQDIEHLASQIIMIDKGKIIYNGQLNNLTKHYGGIKTLALELEDNLKFEIEKSLEDKVKSIEKSEEQIKITFSSDQINAADLIGELIKCNKIVDLSIIDMPLETIVKSIYEEQM